MSLLEGTRDLYPSGVVLFEFCGTGGARFN